MLAAVALAARKKIAPGLLELSFLDQSLQPRGIRNNNPGNILYSDNPCEGKISYELNTDKTFEQFKTYAYGIRAMIRLLQNYMKAGNATISSIVGRWEGSGNQNYVKYVSDRLGVAADAPLSNNKATLKALTQAIADFENGIRSGEHPAVSDDLFEAAWSIL